MINFNVNKVLNFTAELKDLFVDYAFSLDKYFEDEKNRIEHKELYDEYIILNENIKKLRGKYKL